MADKAKAGTEWQDDELDAIVADYFAILDADLSRRPYIKAEHRRALMGGNRADERIHGIQVPQHLRRA